MNISNMTRSKVACFAVGSLPRDTCIPENQRGSVCVGCYGRGGNCRRKQIINNLAENFRCWVENPDKYRGELVACLESDRTGYFRWNWNGDIPDTNYVDLIIDMCYQFPTIKFLVFTKKPEYHALLMLRRPQNLSVKFSAYDVDKFTDDVDAAVAFNDQIPTGWFVCPGECKKCRFCWHSMKKVAFKWHGDAYSKWLVKNYLKGNKK